jgi:hypothetical protein
MGAARFARLGQRIPKILRMPGVIPSRGGLGFVDGGFLGGVAVLVMVFPLFVKFTRRRS